ncbi:MAG: methyl-accepting chemotaxis protein, partial [Pseudolabrys sp.]
MSSINDQLTRLVDGPMKRLELAQTIDIDLVTLGGAEKSLILATDKSKMAAIDGKLGQDRQALRAKIENAVAGAPVDSKPQWTALNAAVNQWAFVQDKIRDAVKTGATQQAHDLSVGEASRLIGEAEKQIEALVKVDHGHLGKAKDAAEARYYSARTMMLTIVVGSLAIGIAAALWIALSISRALGRAGALAQAVAGGDLTKTIENASRDEVGDLIGHINEMVARLRQVVQEALSAADNVSAGSQELSSSSEELSQGATEQASSTEEASSSME